ncbi:MAG TPA: hypothetical protein VHN14_20600 [Kofleriaceae bacterium]|jgi:hypothetical protein|nr:hypothetical protein [Kofleriaceae bacterium]
MHHLARLAGKLCQGGGRGEPAARCQLLGGAASIFGIESEFDVDTEDKLRQFHDARKRLLTGDESARGEVDRLGDELANRSEELREIIALERAQLRRPLEQRRVAP